MLANSADPDQMTHNVASDQCLHCLLTRFSIKNRIKREYRPVTPIMTNGLVQHITMKESIIISGLKHDTILISSLLSQQPVAARKT